MIDEDLKGIPGRIKKIEETLGLNKTEVSEKTGINRSFYYKGSKGEQSISFDFLVKLCSTFNISADWLIFGTGNMFREDNILLTKLEHTYILMIKAILDLQPEQRVKILKHIDSAIDLMLKE